MYPAMAIRIRAHPPTSVGTAGLGRSAGGSKILEKVEQGVESKFVSLIRLTFIVGPIQQPLRDAILDRHAEAVAFPEILRIDAVPCLTLFPQEAPDVDVCLALIAVRPPIFPVQLRELGGVTR